MKQCSEMTAAELIEQFEKDIVYDAHGFTTKFGRSHANKELIERGLRVLAEIVAHLKKRVFSPGPEQELDRAWRSTLYNIRTRHRLWDWPVSNSALEGWIAWAEKCLGTAYIP